METVYRDGKQLRRGYTTGSCAAAAAKAAAALLLTGEALSSVTLTLPNGQRLSLPVNEHQHNGGDAVCAVRKDAGDDPDVTDGVLVYAKVEKILEKRVKIDGGVGIGRVTKPGLDQPVGEAAINSSPREMIRTAVLELADELGYAGGFSVEISIPDGAVLAARTFNPRLGIVGGISVLGTSGIVEPMSEAALTASIRLELRVLAESGKRTVLMTPGNYGETFAKETLGLSSDSFVQCSNFIGESLDQAAACGMTGVLLVGHIGKLVKLAGGIMQTHSRYADCRMELLVAHAALLGAEPVLLHRMMDAVTTDDALEQLEHAGLLEPVMAAVAERIGFYLENRAGAMRAGAVVFSNRFGILAKTAQADALTEILREPRQTGV